MVDESAVAIKSGSFDLVEKEVNSTIEQAETSLDRFQENRESAEELQNCAACLNQLRGIFTLIELSGGIVICEEAGATVNEVAISADEDIDTILASLSQALFILRRYTEYYEKRREDHPELLLEIINRLRSLRHVEPLPESYFFSQEIKPYQAASQTHQEFDEESFQYRSRRLRHMYQVGLLTLLRSADEHGTALNLIARAAAGLFKLSGGSALAPLWLLTKRASELLLMPHMSVSVSRQKLFMQIERYAKNMAKLGKPAMADMAAGTVIRELVYIIATSGDRAAATISILARFEVEPSAFDEAKKQAHLSLLMGPGSDVLKSLAKALHEEIDQIKDKLDIIERGIDTEGDSLEQIGNSLSRLADTLLMLALNKLSEAARQLQTKLKGWSLEKRQVTSNDLLAIADSVLSIEQAIYKLEEEGLTAATDRLAEQKANVSQSPYLTEAMIVVLGESQNSIAMAKRSITAYLESEGDGLHLNNVLSGLAAVNGALEIIGQNRAARALHATAKFIEDQLINTETKPAEHSLDTLADALTSLEYFTDSLNRSATGNVELLTLAEESVKALGYEL